MVPAAPEDPVDPDPAAGLEPVDVPAETEAAGEPLTAPALPEDAAAPPEDAAAPVAPAPVLEVVPLVAEPVLEPEPLACAPVGTVKVGAPEVLVVPVPAPPQAATPNARVAPSPSAARSLITATLTVIGLLSGPERVHAPTTHRAVVQVLLRQLIAPAAEAQVLDRPREL